MIPFAIFFLFYVPPKLVILSSAFKVAVKNGYMRDNPVLLVKRNGVISESGEKKEAFFNTYSLLKSDVQL